MPGHERSHWPSGCLLAVAQVDEHVDTFTYQSRYPNRGDGRIYRKKDVNGLEKAANYTLTGPARARNPFRGANARQRIRECMETRPSEDAKRRKTGLEWDAWLEKCNKDKDLVGHVLLCRHFVMKQEEGGLAPPPPPSSNLAKLIKKRVKALGGRAAFPIKLVRSMSPATFDEALALARSVWT